MLDASLPPFVQTRSWADLLLAFYDLRLDLQPGQLSDGSIHPLPQ